MTVVSALLSSIEMVFILRRSITSKMKVHKRSGCDTFNNSKKTVFITSTRSCKKLEQAISHRSIGESKKQPIRRWPWKLFRSSNYRKTRKKLLSSRKVFYNFAIIPTLSDFTAISTRKLEFILWLNYWLKAIFSNTLRRLHF